MRADKINLRDEGLLLGPLGGKLVVGGGIVGVVGLAAAALLSLGQGANGFWFAYLVGFVYILSLALGALVFVCIQHATRASWSVVVRRIAEFFSNNFLLLAVLALPLVFLGAPYLYEWHPNFMGEHHQDPFHDYLLAHKQPYLNIGFFLLRVTLYFTVWIVLSRYFLSRSLDQDKSGDPEITRRMWTTGGPAILLFALTSTFAAVDFVMTLTPGWFSTMFGVYFFAGSFLSFMALLGLSALLLQGRGHLTHAITTEHYHDIGKLTFAFVFFWGYIAFSQYMLIWYANIPEETAWYLQRQTDTWLHWSLLLLFGHFFIPFLGLMSRWVKRRLPFLAFWCVWVLFFHWVDMVYLIMPTLSSQLGITGLPNLLPALLATIGMFGLFIASAAWIAGGKPIIPIRDPRLVESLQFDNIKV